MYGQWKGGHEWATQRPAKKGWFPAPHLCDANQPHTCSPSVNPSSSLVTKHWRPWRRRGTKFTWIKVDIMHWELNPLAKPSLLCASWFRITLLLRPFSMSRINRMINRIFTLTASIKEIEHSFNVFWEKKYYVVEKKN